MAIEDQKEDFDYEITVPEGDINPTETVDENVIEVKEEVKEAAPVDEIKDEVKEPEVKVEEKAEKVEEKKEVETPEKRVVDISFEDEAVVKADLDKSSLKEDKEVTQEVTLSDDKVLEYLSGKLDKEIKSFDDLNKTSENPLESHPYLKELYEWSNKTGRPIEDWIKYQQDPKDLSDTEVARKFLQNKYPEYDSEFVDYEMSQLLPNDMDTDDEIRAKKHNLKKFVAEGRGVLNKMKSQFNEPLPNNVTPEVQKDLELLTNIKKQYEENTKSSDLYNKTIADVSSKLESIPLELADDLTINFKLSEKDRKELPTFTNELPHLKNEDGSWNHEAIVKNAVMMKYQSKLLKIAYEQGQSAGTENVLKKSKNVSFNETRPVLTESGDKIEIEGGLDAIFGKRYR
jgi:hypothetical protein